VQARKEAGIEMTVAFLEDGNLPPHLQREGVRTLIFEAGRLRDPLRFARTIGSLRRLIGEEKPDAVVGWMTKAHLYGGIAAKLSGVPALYFQMGLTDSGTVDRLARLIPTLGVLTCSEFAARRQREVTSVPVLPVHLACEHDRFLGVRATPPAEMKQRLGFDPNRPLVGIVGRLQRWKGIHVFLEAMAAVMQRHPECQAVVVGGLHQLEPDYPAFLEQRLRDLGLTGRIRMVGAQSNSHEWMQAMDLFVHASQEEPFGIVVIEAMSLGKPVIATKPGGPEEIIEEGCPNPSGILIPPNDPATMAQAIMRLLENPSLSAEMGIAAERRGALFTRENSARETKRAILKLLG
jgi:UDP-N-acetylglucosamine:LPS N-acetylglucosamine transferase